MIEILSSELSQAIQLVGLLEQEGRFVPSRVLLALREDADCLGFGVRGLWIGSGGSVPVEALQDLVWEWLPGPGRKNLPVLTGKCVVCNRTGNHGVVSVEGQSICWEHLACYWEELLSAQAGGIGISQRCPQCGLEGVFFWGARGYCTRCLVNEIKNLPALARWILVGGSALPGRGKGELTAFLEAWRKVGACPRCGSKAIRVRRLIMDFPKAKSPVFPIWELTRQDMRPERIMLRERQLRVFTQGLLRVTVECPQCGYMDLEYPGLELPSRNGPSPFLDF